MTLALAIVVYAASTGRQGQRRGGPPATISATIQISGNATELLYPGGPAAPVDLGFTNPNPFAVVVSGVAARIVDTSNPACGASNFAVSQLASTVRVPQDSTRSLSGLGVPRADWPRISMTNFPSNQGACKNASVRLSYAGRATGPASDRWLMAGTSTGQVFINRQRFRSGIVPVGTSVLIKPGSRLKLRNRTGTIAIYPPRGRSIHFTIRYAFAALHHRTGRDARKPKRRWFTEIDPRGGGFTRCGDPSARGEAPPSRSIWMKGEGSFRIRGRYAIASAHRAWWLIQDLCDGTRVETRAGTVWVNDLAQGTTASPVGAGRIYWAGARKRARSPR